jgi:hypothetical protein
MAFPEFFLTACRLLKAKFVLACVWGGAYLNSDLALSRGPTSELQIQIPHSPGAQLELGGLVLHAEGGSTKGERGPIIICWFRPLPALTRNCLRGS